MNQLAKQISNNIEIIGLRPGEELDENLISKKELNLLELKKTLFLSIIKKIQKRNLN